MTEVNYHESINLTLRNAYQGINQKHIKKTTIMQLSSIAVFIIEIKEKKGRQKNTTNNKYSLEV